MILKYIKLLLLILSTGVSANGMFIKIKASDEGRSFLANVAGTKAFATLKNKELKINGEFDFAMMRIVPPIMGWVQKNCGVIKAGQVQRSYWRVDSDNPSKAVVIKRDEYCGKLIELKKAALIKQQEEQEEKKKREALEKSAVNGSTTHNSDCKHQ